ncbi:cell surface protein, partial [Lactiplantibacillus plantarum]
MAPRTFDFGSVQTYAAEHTYKATTTTNGQQYLQVTDNRGTDEQGWTVTVEQDQDLTETSGSSPHVLTGTTIHVPAGIARNRPPTHITEPARPERTTDADFSKKNKAVTAFNTTATTVAGK